MASLSVLFGLTAALCWGSADYLSRRQSERVGSYKTVLYAHVMTLVVVAALLPVLHPSFEVGPVVALVLTATGLVNFFAFILLYRAFHKGVVSVVALVAYTFPAVTTVLSIAVLGVALAATSIIAIAWIIVGVVLVSTKLSALRATLSGKGAPNVTAGVGSAVGSSVFFGVAYVGLGYSIPLVGYVLPVVFLRGVATVAGFLLAPLLKQEVRPSRSALSNTIIVMGVLEAIGFLAFSYGVSQGGSSLPVVAAVSGMGGAVAAAYGLVFLRERLELNQILGVVLALTGVFTLLYLGG
ncbi:MAG: EamA family transporter [Nitrososphaerales archaeon]